MNHLEFKLFLVSSYIFNSFYRSYLRQKLLRFIFK